MKITRNFTRISKNLFFVLILFASQTYAQEFSLNNDASQLTVFGTSNVHDWEIKAENQSGKMVLNLADQLKLTQLKVVIKTEGLKSGKGGMDKNTYKALKSDKHKNITFEMKDVGPVSKGANGVYNVSGKGNLTIAGVTKTIGMDFTLELVSNRAILKGKKSLKMTDYGISPPKALLGTITTGDEITIDFNTVLIK